jgi:hypothetical protein
VLRDATPVGKTMKVRPFVSSIWSGISWLLVNMYPERSAVQYFLSLHHSSYVTPRQFMTVICYLIQCNWIDVDAFSSVIADISLLSTLLYATAAHVAQVALKGP